MLQKHKQYLANQGFKLKNQKNNTKQRKDLTIKHIKWNITQYRKHGYCKTRKAPTTYW